MKKNLFILSVVCLAVSGCAGAPTPIPDAQSSIAQLYVEKCGACHAVPHPKRNTATEWSHLFKLMEQRMAERNMAAFSIEEKEVLMNYLQSNAR